MSIRSKPPRYEVFLLRYWEARDEEASATHRWQFCLENPETGVRHGFSSLESLIEFIEDQLTTIDSDSPSASRN